MTIAMYADIFEQLKNASYLILKS